MIEGVDYSTSRPDPVALFEAGKRFVVRYGGPGTSDKHLTPDEAVRLSNAGLSIVANAEGTAKGLLGGRATGVAWAARAFTHFQACGMPVDRPIYFSVDWDVQAGEWPVVHNALRGAESILGAGRVGVYGGRNAVTWAMRDIPHVWTWQTYAWSGIPAVWVPGCEIQQYRNGINFDGQDIDLDRAMSVDYGQWSVKKGDAVSQHTDDIIEAWRNGVKTAADGSFVAPVDWRIRDEAWQATVTNSLGRIENASGVTLTPEQLDTVITQLKGSLVSIVEDVIGRTGLTVRPQA